MGGTVVVVGGGPVGLATAMLLAADGRSVTVLERDPAGPPSTAAEAFATWERSGVAQFRMAHGLWPKLYHTMQAELPAVLAELVASGGLVANLIDTMPGTVTDRSSQPGDDRFATVTGRRPFVERAFGVVAENAPGVDIRRGATVTGLQSGTPIRHGVPHVAGVTLESGEVLPADLVIDARGRRSRLAEWLDPIGAPPPMEEASDAGFAYYVRHYRSRSGPMPKVKGPIFHPAGTVSVLTLPGDNDCWTVGISALAGDQPLKRLRHSEVFQRVGDSIPPIAHWFDGEPLGEVLAMSGVMDRWRRMVVNGQPVVTGLVAVGDAWACTNPLAGRGITMGVAHAVLLRDALRQVPDDPGRLAAAFDEATETTLTPWYQDQVIRDRGRVSLVRALIEGAPPPAPANPAQAMGAAFVKAAMFDPMVARGFLDVQSCLALPAEVLSRPGMREAVGALAGTPPPAPLGPDRGQLLALLN